MYKFLVTGIFSLISILQLFSQGVENDNCSNAIDLLQCGREVNTQFATNSNINLNTAACGSLKNGKIFNDVWYKVKGRKNGKITLDGCDLSGDAVLAVYATSTCPQDASIQLLTCSDDNSDCSNPLSPKVEFDAAKGSVYLIRIGSAVENEPVSGFIGFQDTKNNIENDDCYCALPVEDGVYSYLTKNASNTSNEYDEVSCDADFNKDAWYTYTPTCNSVISVSSCNSNIETIVAVYNSTGVCDEKAIPISCDTSSCENGGKVEFLGNANQTYYFRVGAVNENDNGEITLVIESDCNPKTELEAPFELTDNIENYTSNCPTLPEHSASFRFEVYCDGEYNINTKFSDFFPRFDLGLAQCDNSIIDGKDLNLKSGKNGFKETVYLTQGVYYVTVYPNDTNQLGNFNLKVKFKNDKIDDIIDATTRMDTLYGDILEATDNCCLIPTKDYVYQVEAVCKGNYRFNFRADDDTRPFVGKAFLTTAECGGEILDETSKSGSDPADFGTLEATLDPGTYYITFEGIERRDTVLGPLGIIPFVFEYGEFRLTYEAACNDMSIQLVEGPDNDACRDLGNELISVFLENTGAQNAPNYDVQWVLELDSVGIDSVTENISKLLRPEDTFTYTFLRPLPLETTGSYNLIVKVIPPVDDIPYNSIQEIPFTRSISIADYPYSERFEDGSDFILGGDNSSWIVSEITRERFFIPLDKAPNSNGEDIMQLAVGGGGEQDYNSYENSFAVGPCFDLTVLDCPQIRFDLKYETEYLEDGLILEYSTNFGQSWKQLGAHKDGKGENWYNVPYLDEGSLYEDTKRGAWSGNYYIGGPRNWVTAKYPLEFLKDRENVKFRFRFLSGRSRANQGAVIDNFVIEEKPQDVELVRFANSLTYCANGGYEMPTGVLVKNNTCDTLTQLTLSLQTQPDSNDITEIFEVNIIPNTSEVIEFTNLPILVSDLNTLEVSIVGDIDEVVSNNTLSTEIDGTVYNAQLNKLNENFNNDFQCDEDCEASCDIDGYWHNETATDNADWLVNKYGTSTSATGPANGEGKYAYIEASGCDNQTAELISSCLFLDPEYCYILNVDYHMFGSDIRGLHFDVEVDGEWMLDFGQPLLGAQQSYNTADWKTAEVNLGQFSGQNVRLRIRGETGFGEYGDLAIDNIRIDRKDSDLVDLSVSNLVIDNANSCEEMSRTMSVNIANISCETFDSTNTSSIIKIFDYARNLVESVPVDLAIPSISPGEEVSLPINLDLELVENGIYLIEFTAFVNDPKPSNNTTEAIASLRPYISEYPYEETFESADLTWSPNPEFDLVWEYGQPNGRTIKGQSNAWTTIKDDRYKDNQNAVLESPCFDLSDLCYPTIELDIWWDTEAARDGAKVQVSTDNGTSWNDLGGFPNENPARNWYTGRKVTGLTLGNWIEGWSGSKGTGSGSEQYVSARFGLSEYLNSENIRFRVIFGSDAKNSDHDGISIDAVRLYDGKPELSLPNTIELCGGVEASVDFSQYLNGSGFSPYFVSLTPSDSFSSINNGVATFTPFNQDIEYDVLVELNDVTTCSTQATTTIKVVYTPQAEILTETVCYSDQETFLQAIDNEGVWKGRGIIDTNSNQFDPFIRTGLGTYEITHYVGNTLGCVTYDTAFVTVIDGTSAEVYSESEIALCTTNEPFQFYARNNGGTWAGGNIDQTGLLTPSTLAEGEYIITHRFGAPGSECFDEDTIVVTITEPQVITINPLPELCNTGDIVTISAKPEGGSWSGPGILDPFAGTFNPEFAGAGVQSVQYLVKDEGCLLSRTFDLDVFEQPDLSLVANQDQSLCVGDIVTIELQENNIARNDGLFNSIRGEERNNIYIFSTTETLDQETDTLPKGVYTIEYAYDANGCNGISNLRFELSSPLKVSVDTKPACFNEEDGKLTANVKGGTQPYNISWKEGAKLPVNGNVIRDLGPFANVTLTVRDNFNCQVTIPNISTGENDEIVQVLDDVRVKSIAGEKYVEVLVTNSGGTGPYTSIWSDGATTEDNLFAQTSELSVRVLDTIECSANFNYSLDVDLDGLALGSEQLAFSEYLVYPNPSQNFFNIEFTAGTFTEISIEDMSGRTVYRTTVDSSTEILKVNAQDWANGQYLVRFMNESSSVVEQIVKQ